MTFSSLIIVLFIFILAGVIIIKPFLDTSNKFGGTGSGVYDSLLAERERLLSSIEELDLDLELSKISPREHGESRDQLLSEAAEVLRKLDKNPQKGQAKKKTPLAARGEDDLDKLIKARRNELQAEKSKICVNCGKPLQEGAKFCSHCGRKQ
ncbi:MAG: zinc-ribbon domain-containing protein [Anaerolineales bacterium]|nr:MAG: zinc-ribbon domain-containing protein [Anaerolineales bacterium]